MVTLSKIYKYHPVWEKMKSILSNGSVWPLELIDDNDQKADVDAAITFGNHKGAVLRRDELIKLVSKDVLFGYALPLPLRIAKKLPGLLIAPMNIMDQNSIDECGRIV